MPFLSRQRRIGLPEVATGAGLFLTALGLTGTSVAQEIANAPSTKTAQLQAAKVNFVRPPDPLHVQQNCGVVRRGFDVMKAGDTLTKFEGPPTEQDRVYEGRIYGWIGAGCTGDVPIPDTPRSMRWFSATAGVLQNSSYGIRLVP